MPIVAADIKYYLSGGAANADPALSLGGIISATEVAANTLFDDISSAEASAGDTEYRCIYVKNTHATISLTVPKAFIQANTTGSRIAIALAGEGLSVAAETVANESTAPVGEVFATTPVDYATGLAMVTIPAGGYHGIWVRRVIPAAAVAATDTYTVRVQGETVA